MENFNKNSALIDIDLSGLIKKYLKNWYLFAISIIACGVITFAYVKIKKDIYLIKADILISDENSSGGSMQSAMLKSFSFGNLVGGGGKVDDEINMVSAHSTLREVVKDLGLNKKYILRHSFFDKEDLYKNYPIEIYASPTVEDTLSTTLNFKVRIDEAGHIVVKVNKALEGHEKVEGSRFPLVVPTQYGDFILNSTPHYVAGEKLATNISICGYDKAAEDVNTHTFISIPDKKSNLIHLEIEESDIDRGKDLLNTIIQVYNQRGIDEKNKEAEIKAGFIDERIDLVMRDLAQTEKQIEEYKKKNNLTDIETEAKIILEQNTVLKEKQIEIEAQNQMVEIIENFLRQEKNRYSLIPFNPSLSDEASAAAIQQYNTLVLKRMEIAFSAKGDNKSLAILDEQIDATRNNVLSTLKSIRESLTVSQKTLLDQEDKFGERIKNMPTQEREFIDMQRQQLIKQELFLFLLQKREENALNQSMATPKSTIVNAAYNLSEPISTPKIITLFVGLLIGAILPIIYLYLKDLLRTKFSNRNELEALTALPVLGEICTHKNKDHIVIREGENSSIAELFRLIRNNIQFVLNNKDEKVILVTSSISGEGKSFISSNLAISMALLGKRVLLIGMDIRNPQLGSYLNIRSPKGLTNYLADTSVSISDITLSSAIQKGMDIILAGPVPPNPSELLLSNRVDELFGQLREIYDYIIIDSAPVSMVADTFSLTRIADTTVYVCRANYTKKEYIRYVNRIAAEKRLGKVSIILNGTEAQQGYGYGKNTKK